MTVTDVRPVDTPAGEKLGIIDTDFHPMPLPTDPQVAEHLPQRWRDYIARYGLGSFGGGVSPSQREFTHRLDAVDERGRVGVDPQLAIEQVVDKYDMSAVVLTCPQTYIITHGGANMPHECAFAIYRAYNDALAHTWASADDRFKASITLPRDLAGAADEIARCKEGPNGDAYVQVLMSPAGQDPLGKQRYWPIFEACEHYDIPLGFHVPGMGRQPTGAGRQNFYAEMHAAFAVLPISMVSSLVFEGVFERFPKLKIALLELGWDWAAPFSWRLDASFAKLGDELPHLNRKPSEYLREHFWFSTQPIEEPESPLWTPDVYAMFEESGFADRLMFSSDYPHWDFDSPYESVPQSFPLERRRRILGANASALYKIPLRPGHGIPAVGA
ncbi:amidohydrolase family protein [Saccharopolyspora sp. ASAGF58]|uniref:amidohydrolase family protein n=1 Tax=Saccharopolyspora sp. ASAGF58 TaxID=2719023 RepID=UPI00143FB949|nr:amidohydrolase family protein [Saccharopolyspora sp. ASAGF58]QIZ37760.1 amidohydrolase [Saccharopolyspora sp. ASAGF58]